MQQLSGSISLLLILNSKLTTSKNGTHNVVCFSKSKPQVTAASCAPSTKKSDFFSDPNLKIIAKPGRFFPEMAFTLVTHVIGERVRGEKIEYLIDDGIYGSFRPTLYNSCFVGIKPISVENIVKYVNHRPFMDQVAGHRTEMGRFDRVVDRYRDEPNRNYRDGGLIPSRPTIYRDRTGTDRNGPEWNGMG
ncbi:hypothetical protein H5410_017518 [Solanum commersonii]|uniref:Orn/DAP/Arg decarboxylase 2 C-terminal domain-containing protein n=1 Tax=Solanum commersonii TaxID=4109 RepID=A0A9J5ZZA8_SOLCO|nr:hypothetical protein H5410_017518 [Solanum commersonii]